MNFSQAADSKETDHGDGYDSDDGDSDEHKELSRISSFPTQNYSKLRKWEVSSPAYLTIVTAPKPVKYGYQNTKRYKPSSSYLRVRLYPIPEIDENLEEFLAFGSEYLWFKKKTGLIPRPVLRRHTDSYVQDINTPSWRDHACGRKDFREGYPMQLRRQFHSKEHRFLSHYLPSLPFYAAPCITNMLAEQIAGNTSIRSIVDRVGNKLPGLDV